MSIMQKIKMNKKMNNVQHRSGKYETPWPINNL